MVKSLFLDFWFEKCMIQKFGAYKNNFDQFLPSWWETLLILTSKWWQQSIHSMSSWRFLFESVAEGEISCIWHFEAFCFELVSCWSRALCSSTDLALPLGKIILCSDRCWNNLSSTTLREIIEKLTCPFGL